MDVYCVDLSTPPIWAPLLKLSELCKRRSRTIDISRFMYMGVARGHGLPDVLLYKCAVTLAYLCLDAGGHAYRPSHRAGRLRLQLEHIGTTLTRVAAEPTPRATQPSTSMRTSTN